MQNKKILSVCLTVLLLCICLVGVFSLSVSAVTPVTWKVTGTANPDAGEYASLQDAMNAAAAKTDWQGTDELTIELVTSEGQTFQYDSGLLFNVNTIFTQANTKLPITITGGTISVSGVPMYADETLKTATPVACTNDYTFKDLTFRLGERYIAFYAGSGEVVFDHAEVYNGNNQRAYFYGDNFTSAAFDGWTEANVAAEKGEDGLIPVSLTFKNTDYASTTKVRFAGMNGKQDFAAEGDLVSAADLHVGMTIQDSRFGTGYLRFTSGTDAATSSNSPVGKLTFNVFDTSSDHVSNTYIRELLPYGNEAATKDNYVELGETDLEVNITGGDFSANNITFLRGISFKGDVEINISGGKFDTEVNLSDGDSATMVEGNVVANITGGTFVTLRGSHAAGYGLEEGNVYRNVVNVTGGTITTYQGSRQCPTAYGSLINNVSGSAKITTFWGAYVSASAGGGNYGYIENNIFGGTITTFNGGGQLKGGYATDIVNNISGGTIGNYVGAGNADVKGTLTNNISGGTITGKYIGTTDGLDGREDETINIVRNNFTGGTVNGALCCTGARPNKEVYNTFDGTLVKGAYYGSYGTADYVENRFVSGEVVGEVDGTKATTKDVVNYLQGGTYCTSSTRYFFYGTKGTTTGTVTNYIEGTFNAASGHKSGANTYLTGGSSKDIVNHFHSANFSATVYANDGNFNTITNHYYGTYVATKAHHGGAASSNVIPTNGSEARTITNNFYPGAQLGTFYGADGKQDPKVSVAKITNNIDGATIQDFHGGLFRGAALEIVNNVQGNAEIGTYHGGNALGLIVSGSTVPTVITPTITNNISEGTFNNYFGGNGNGYRDYTNDTIINNISGGTFNSKVSLGSDSPTSAPTGAITDWRDLEIINTITGGTFNVRVYGSGGSVKTVTNTLVGGDFIGSFSGSNGNADTVTNYIQGGAYDVAGNPRNYFYGSNGTSNKVTNYVDGDATFADNGYLSNGTSKLVENHFYSIGEHSNFYGSQGKTELTRNYFYEGFVMQSSIRGTRGTDTAMAEGEKREVENYFYGGDFTVSTFIGTDGGQKVFPTTSKVTNYVMGGAFASFIAGGGRGDAYEINTVITGDATINNYYGGSSSRYDDGADTTLAAVYTTTLGTESADFTGYIANYYGGNQSSSPDVVRAAITNTVNSGTVGNFVGGSLVGTDSSVTNIINGGTIENVFYGGANDANVGGTASVEGAVDTTINGGIFYGYVSSVEGQPVKLNGEIGIGATAQIVATEATDVTLVQQEYWVSGHQYLIIPESFLDQVTTANADSTVDGIGFLDPSTGVITGFSMPKGTIMASLALEERVVLKLWFPKEDVDVYLETLGKAFEYSVTLNDNGTPLTLAEGSIASPRKADLTYSANGETKDYYVVTLSGIGAGSFGKTITVTGSSFSFTNSVLNLAETGAKAYAGTVYETLFQSIYDYGASASGLITKFDHLPYSTDLAASVITKADNAVATFSSVDALMGDAVGIRFIGTPGASYDPAGITVKLDGTALIAGTDYRITTAGNQVNIDIFFKAAYMSTDMTITVEAGGVEAFRYESSVERTVADIVKEAPNNQRAIALLVYIQQVKAYLG